MFLCVNIILGVVYFEILEIELALPKVSIKSAILGLLGFAGKNSKQQNQLDLDKNKRLHHRYAISSLDCYLSVQGQDFRGKVKDLSYSGIGLEVDLIDQTIDFPSPLDGHLSILGKVVNFSASKVFIKDNFMGLSFQHRETSVLLFIRDILEFCRFGASTGLIGRTMLQKKYSDPSWLVGRGDGPSDLSLKISLAKNSVEEANWSFIDAQGAHRLYFNGRDFFEGSAISHAAVRADGSKGKEASIDLLRHFAFYLTGLTEDFPKEAVDCLLALISERCINPGKSHLKLA